MNVPVHGTGGVDPGLNLAARAEAEIQNLERLLSRARSAALAAAGSGQVRRRRGSGSEFWQFRDAEAGEPHRRIDWRQSARTDRLFVKERELESPDTLLCWADNSASMAFEGWGSGQSKSQSARILALALAMLFQESGDRTAIVGGAAAPSSGREQITRMAEDLLAAESAEYGVPPKAYVPRGAGVVLFSDFLGGWTGLERAVRRLAAQQVRGSLVQVLDPAENEFPYSGRTRFQSPGGSISQETLQAGGIREDYRETLGRRQQRIRDLAADLGWHAKFHRTDEPSAPVLFWLCGALEAEI